MAKWLAGLWSSQEPMVTVLILAADLCYYSCYVKVLATFVVIYLSFDVNG
jgi:hypothetical protein